MRSPSFFVVRAAVGVLLCLLVAVGCVRVTVSAQRTPEFRVRVEAGESARRETPFRFAIPEALHGAPLVLVDEAGLRIAVQVEGGEGVAVVDSVAAGGERRYRLRRGMAPESRGVVAQRDASGVAISSGGQPVLRYNATPTELPRADLDPVFRRGGYIHPVVTPSGRTVTGDYPAGHPHHHGIWSAWTRTVFEDRAPDFWNMGQRRGTVEPVALDSVWSGPVHAGFSARHRMVDLTAPAPREAIRERWTVRVYDVAGTPRPYRLFDLEVHHTTASSAPLTLPEYHYGGVGFRGPDAWDGAPNTLFLTSEGRDRSDGHATRARWVHVSGTVDGTRAGVAILGHPDNLRYPEPMRIHPTEPFFNWAPSQLGDWSIRPDAPFTARYRYIVFDGPPDPAELERLWRDFAHPPRATVEQ
jgi:hypothetical protein